MGVYKVIQDIEAEDKLLGPLTLRQFIFGLIAVLFFYLSFISIAKHVPFLLVAFLPPGLIATFFAWPFSADQPTEVWALAKLRFFFKPRRRIWDQSGVKDLVTITAPRKVAEPPRTNGLSSHEVNSRLNALANTIDSRGWAIKNSAINLSAQAPYLTGSNASDRLVDASSLPQEVPNYDVQAADDILDEENNPIAQQFDQMINASTQAHRQELMQMMQQPTLSLPTPVSDDAIQQNSAQTPQPTPPPNYWFLNQPAAGNQPAASVVTPGTNDGQRGVVQAAIPTAEEEALAERLKTQHEQPDSFVSHMKTIQPLSAQKAQPAASKPAPPVPNPELLQLATNNDLNVATLARQANKEDDRGSDLGEHEVVVSLH